MEGSIFDIHRLWEEILERSKESEDPNFAEFPVYLKKIYPKEPKLEELD